MRVSFIRIYGIIMASLIMILSGCAHTIKNFIYPRTEHAKCIEKCEEKYGASKDAYMETACKKRCDRDLGWEESIPK